jgi:hypothetical protein
MRLHVTVMLLFEYNHSVRFLLGTVARLGLVICAILRDLVVCPDMAFVGVHLVILNGNIDNLDFSIFFIPLLAYAARLAHELANDLIHDSYVLRFNVS